MRFFDDLLYLFFPRICCTCGKVLVKNEEIICFGCRSQLPKTRYTSLDNNEIKERFDGKLRVNYAMAMLQFHKAGLTQKLLHEFKYNNKPEIGELFGRQLGQIIKNSGVEQEIDQIIPVPLHPKKERQRGYNQSRFFAFGISDQTGIDLNTSDLIRVKHSESQTGKTRELRWVSVEKAFELRSTTRIKARHILLVDDVITTGATLEACGKKLLEAGATDISVAALAIAK